MGASEWFIYFVSATFVQTMPTFWVKVPSTVLQPYTATATTTTQTTTRTTTQTDSKTTMRLRSTTETGTATYNTTPNSGTRHAGILIAVRGKSCPCGWRQL